MARKYKCANPEWANTLKGPKPQPTLTVRTEELKFKQFDRLLLRGSKLGLGCSPERREMVFGSVGWKFDFSAAKATLKKARAGGRKRKL